MSQKLKFVQDTIENKGSEFLIPQNLYYQSYNTHSWFDIKTHNSYNTENGQMFFEHLNEKNISFDDIHSDGMKTMQVKLFLTQNQKIIIDKWFDMFVLMYNATINLINTKLFNSKSIPSLNEIKKMLNGKKDEIQVKSKIIIKNEENKLKDVFVDRHLLDYAIQDALNRYKSCQTSFKKKLVKHFCLRYLKMTKPNKIIKIERLAFREKTFYSSVLGKEVKCSTPNFNYLENVKSVAILTKRNNEYYLLVKHKKKIEVNKYNNETIGIDLGTNPIATCYSNTDVIQIGKNVSKKIEKKLKKIDKINGYKGYLKEKKDRISARKYKRIKDMINDMQWKTAKYLTENYRDIIIGNMSTKRMGEGNIAKIVKRVGNMISIHRLKEKIKYKCEQKGRNYKEVDEAYTTQGCGRCGNMKKNIGGKKIYECGKCKLKVNRDVNSARIITMIGI